MKFKIRHILVAIVALMLTACKPSIPDTPISQTIPDEELAKLIEKRPEFADQYQLIRDIYDSTPEAIRAPFDTLTYNRLVDYLAFANDSVAWSKTRKELRKQWKKEFGPAFASADSMLQCYYPLLDTLNNLSRFVHVSFNPDGLKDGDVTRVFSQHLESRRNYTAHPMTSDRLEDAIFEWTYSAGAFDGEIKDGDNPDRMTWIDNGAFFNCIAGDQGMRITSLTINGKKYSKEMLPNLPYDIYCMSCNEYANKLRSVEAKNYLAQHTFMGAYIPMKQYVEEKCHDKLIARDMAARNFFERTVAEGKEGSEANLSDRFATFFSTLANVEYYQMSDADRKALFEEHVTPAFLRRIKQANGDKYDYYNYVFLYPPADACTGEQGPDILDVKVDNNKLIVKFSWDGLENENTYELVDNEGKWQIHDIKQRPGEPYL